MGGTKTSGRRGMTAEQHKERPSPSARETSRFSLGGLFPRRAEAGARARRGRSPEDEAYLALLESLRHPTR